MGRKKKVKEINVNDSNSIKYFGDVTIQRVRKGKVVSTVKQHNAGGSELFRFLLNCLAGQFVAVDKPSVVTPAFEENNIIKYRSNLCYDISNISFDTTTPDNYFVEYKFYLPYSTQFTEGDGFNRLVIYSDRNNPGDHTNGEQIYSAWSMYVVLDQYIKPDLDEDLIITWHLKVENIQE